MSTLYRAQILLEPEQHQALAQLARDEGRSLSDLVREIVQQHLARQEQQARLQQEKEAIHALTQIRERLQAQYGSYPTHWLEEVRAERDHDIETVSSDRE